ncbi:MAG: Pr6Pr family membrane protein [Bifidobacteriaceae bacterium]|nr:Pr6Pr family membrane protein [Bifidobacteriaceae bacterium]
MAITRRYVALVFRLCAVALIATGLIRLLGVFGEGVNPGMFLYYTTQSNVLVLIWMIAMVAVTIRDIRREGPRGLAAPWPRLGAAVMMAITVTMQIYLVVLAPSAFIQSGGGYVPFTLTDDLIHIVTPCLAIADWFMFAPKGRIRFYDPPLWAIIPYAYLAFGFTWAALGGSFGMAGRYPYPFMDVDALGVGGVALQILVLSVTLISFGYLFVLADKLMARRARRGPAAAAAAISAEAGSAEAG